MEKKFAYPESQGDREREGKIVYDSKEDTLNHKEEVRKLMDEFASELIKRGNIHDTEVIGIILNILQTLKRFEAERSKGGRDEVS